MSRANRANSLLQDELLQEAFTRLEAEYVKHWRESLVSDQQGRERLFLAINVLGKVKQHLHTVIETGKMAEHELQYLVKTRKK